METKKTSKRTIIVLVFLICLSLALYIRRDTLFNILAQKKIHTGPLSSRGKEYLRDSHSPQLKNARTSSQPQKAQFIEVPGCFSFSFPYSTTISRKHYEGCSWYMFSPKPRLKLTVSMRQSTLTSLDDDPSINLYRARSTAYTEDVRHIDGVSYLTFISTTGAYDIIGFRLVDSHILSVRLAGYSTEKFDSVFEDVVRSIELLN